MYHWPPRRLFWPARTFPVTRPLPNTRSFTLPLNAHRLPRTSSRWIWLRSVETLNQSARVWPLVLVPVMRWIDRTRLDSPMLR